MRGVTLARSLARSRAAVLVRMRATCTIDRPGPLVTLPGGEVVQSATRVYPDPSWAGNHPHAHGPCYGRYPGLAFEQTPEAGGAQVTVSRLVVRIPHGVQILPHDVVTWVSDPDNPVMVGTLLLVGSVDDQSQATAQRILVDDYQGARIVVGDDESES